MKKIILTIVAVCMSVSINAQSDCATAQAIPVGVNDSYVMSAPAVSGNIPSEICSGGYAATDITLADWYSYTATQDIVVTVTAANPTANTDYFAAFNVFTGACASLTCVGGAFLAGDGAGGLVPAEYTFVAYSGETYYIVFDNAWNQLGGGQGGQVAPFEFTVVTDDSYIPTEPHVATNPMPADGATNVEIVEMMIGGQQYQTVDFSWEAATTGDPATRYNLYLSNPQSADPTELFYLGYTFLTEVTLVDLVKEHDATYYWKVVPKNAAGEATGAPTWSFTTEEALSINDVEETNFVHFINNNILNIQSQVQMDSFVVYNMLGKKVLTNNVSGNNLEVNISQLATGVYIAQLEQEGKVQTFKFVKR